MKLFINLLVCFLSYAYSQLEYEDCMDNVKKEVCFDCTDPMAQFCQKSCSRCLNISNVMKSVSAKSILFGRPISYTKYLITYSDYYTRNCYLDINKNNEISCSLSSGIEFYLIDVYSAMPSFDKFIGTVSFQSAAGDVKYLRHQSFLMRLDPFSLTDSDAADDRSFYIHQNGLFISIQSAHPSYLYYYMVKSGDKFKIEKTGTITNNPKFNLVAIVHDLNITMIEIISQDTYLVTATFHQICYNKSDTITISCIDSNRNQVFFTNLLYTSINSVSAVFSLNKDVIYTFSAGMKNEFGFYVYGNKVNFYANSNYLAIISIKSINRSSVEIILKPDNLIMYLDIKCIDQNNVTNFYPVENYQSVVSSLESYSLYTFSAGVRNAIGVHVYKELYVYLTDEDVPTDYPQNFVAATANFTTLLLSWSEVKYPNRKGIIVNYIYFCNSTENNFSNMVNNNTFQITMSNLNPDAIYNCSVAACTKVGCGVQAFEYNRTLVGIPSGPPLNFTVVPVNFSTMLLTWGKVEYSKTNGTIIGYTYLCNSTVVTWNLVDNNTFQVIVSNLTFNTTYNCTIKACTKLGCGVQTSLLNKTLDGLPQESAEITYIGSINSSSINVSWNDISILEWGVQENQSFCLDIENSSQIIQTKCFDFVMSNYNININGLEPYTNYTVLVYAKNKAGIGFKDNDKKKQVQTDEFFPTGFPLNFTAVKVNYTALLLSWDNVEYSLRNGIIIKYFYSCNNTEDIIFNTVDSSVFNVVVINLDPDAIYNCSVAACTKVGCGVQTYVFNNTLDGIPTGFPLNFTVAKVNFTTLLLSWDNVEYSMRNGIIIKYFYSCNNTEVSFSNSVSNNTFNVTFSNLNPDTIYNCSVAACTKVGCGVKAFVFNNTLVGIPTGFPSNFTVKKVNLTTLLLSWDNVEYSMRNGIIIKYIYSCNNTKNYFSNSVYNNTFNVTVSILDPDTIYNCSVAACTKVGCGVNVTTLVETAWSQWGAWTSCNISYGYINRTRECDLYYSTRWCQGSNLEVEQCSEKWAMWSKCSVTCGEGNRTRYSLQAKPIIKVESCKLIDCPVDGTWGAWVSLNCSTTCGNGIKIKKRICKEPLFNGRDCIGVSNYTDVCDTDIVCPVNGNFSKWSSWSLCNQPCGGGMKSRFRSCSNPYPMFGGQGCYGNLTEFKSCNQQTCKSVDLNLKVYFMDKKFHDILALEDILQAAISNIYSSFKVSRGYRVVIHSIDVSS